MPILDPRDADRSSRRLAADPAAPEPLLPSFDDLADESAAATLVEPSGAGAAAARAGRPNLVVVRTRAAASSGPEGSVLVTRFWHPRDRRWSENHFESLEHALRLFVDESGWALRQQQDLQAAHAYELIFEARREDFAGPSTDELLEEVGFSPADVATLMDRVDRHSGPD